MLIGMTGRATAGKDTVFRRLRAMLPETEVVRASFADALYDSAAAALGVTREELALWKNDASVVIQVRDFSRPGGRIETELTVREYLQRYGTEAHREVFGEDFWVKALDLSHAERLVVVTDVRFENEAAHIREHGGKIVRVVGTEETESAPIVHPSEAGVSNPWRIIYNGARDPDLSREDYEHAVDLWPASAFEPLDAQLKELVKELAFIEAVAGSA